MHFTWKSSNKVTNVSGGFGGSLRLCDIIHVSHVLYLLYSFNQTEVLRLLQSGMLRSQMQPYPEQQKQAFYWRIHKGKAEDSPAEEKHWSKTQNPNFSWEWVLLRVSENLDLETLYLEVPSNLTEFYTHPSTLHPTCPSLHHLDQSSRMLGLGTADLDALCASY